MTETSDEQSSIRWVELASLGALYVIWGSTYLAINIAVDTIPPLLMTGARFLSAGILVLIWKWPRHGTRPTAVQWRSALIVGSLMILGGNGGVALAQELGVPTGFTALMIGAVPIWITVLNWLLFGGAQPNGRMALGLAFGLSGLVLLIGPAALVNSDEDVSLSGLLVLVCSALSWATGSLYSRRASLPDQPLLATGMELLMGGVALVTAGTFKGEWANLDLSRISAESVIALVYLSLIGALVAFSAYNWLLRNTTPTRATSYAYVNPVVAMILGWLALGEAITLRMVIAAAIIVGSVAVITSVRAQQPARTHKNMAAERHLPRRTRSKPARTLKL